KVCFIDCAALLMLITCALESSISKSAGEPEYRLLKGILYRAAEPEGETVLFAEIMIELEVERSIVLSELRILLIVIGRRHICMRHQCEELKCNGAHESYGDHVGAGSCAGACRVVSIYQPIAALNSRYGWRR